jgi:DNA polymerase-3 subunit epsilon
MSQPSLFDASNRDRDGERDRDRDRDREHQRPGATPAEPSRLQHLALDRPLVVFDLETTGIDLVADRIVQVAMIRLEPDGSRRVLETLVDPQRPIPAEATAVHGITDDDVRGKPTVRDLLPELERILAGADLAGYNSISFDQPMLQEELSRAGSQLDLGEARHVDAMVIFKRKERRDLTAALKFYCDRDLVDAHSALADAEATLAILDAQLGRYDDLPRDVAGLHEYSAEHRRRYVDVTRKFKWDDDGEAVLNFGKVRGRRLRDVVADPQDRGFLEWMLGKDFTSEVKTIVRAALAGEFPRRPVTPADESQDDGADDS